MPATNDAILIPPDPPTEKTKLKNIVFNCENLSSLEILQEFNKHVSSLAPKEDDLSGGPKTKLEKKAAKRR